MNILFQRDPQNVLSIIDKSSVEAYRKVILIDPLLFDEGGPNISLQFLDDFVLVAVFDAKNLPVPRLRQISNIETKNSEKLKQHQYDTCIFLSPKSGIVTMWDMAELSVTFIPEGFDSEDISAFLVEANSNLNEYMNEIKNDSDSFYMKQFKLIGQLCEYYGIESNYKQ